MPARQLAQTVEAAEAEKVPEAQLVQLDAPKLGWYLPEVQLLQLVYPAERV